MLLDFKDPSRPEPAWFEIPADRPEEVAGKLMATVSDIEQRQSSIWTGNQRHAKLYSGYLPKSFDWGALTGANRVPFAATKGLVRSVCDTATALISRFRPRSTFVTTGANWELQQKAEDMDICMAAAYHRGNLYPVASRSFHDSTVFGTGCWKYVERPSGDDYFVEVVRVNPNDLVVDEDECLDNLDPENTYHRVVVSASALIRKYANGDSDEDRKRRQAIMTASDHCTWAGRSTPLPKGRVVVVDACHVDHEGNGHRRVIAIQGLVLRDEKWPWPWHPYTFLWWTTPLGGFYGDGVAYRQFGRQERISYMYRWVQRCHDLFATPRAWVDPAGGPVTSQLSNELGVVVSARRPPTFQNNPVVPPEIYAWIDELARGGFEDEGISQSTASNEVPRGLESAPAQREYSFKESNRFAPVSQRWEHAIAVDAAYKMMAMYRRRAKTTKPPVMKWADRKTLYTVEWPDLPEDSFMIRPMASSLESLSPAARLQAAIELANTNWLKPGEGRAMMAHPDLERADELDNAPRAYAEGVLKRLLKGEKVPVDEYADLVTLDEVIRKGRLNAINRKAPQHLIDNCSEYLDNLDMITTQANQAQMAQQAALATPPMSQPAAQGMVPMTGGQG